MNSSLVSIVLPVYNVSDYVGQCLQSIIDQTYDNLEIIVIDDGSTDSSGEICETFASEDSRIRLYHRQNSGLSAARNFGIKQSTGEWIIFVDSDDFIERHMIEQMLQAAEACSAQIIIGQEISVGSEDTDFEFPKQDSSISQCRSADSETVLEDILNNRTRRTIWGILFKMDLVRNQVFPEGKRFEDIPFLPLTMISDPKVAYLNRKVYGYRSNSSSFMHSKEASVSKDRLEMKELQIQRIIEICPQLKAVAIGSLYNDCMLWWRGADDSDDQKAIDEFRAGILQLINKYRPSWNIIADRKLTIIRRVKLIAGCINFPFTCSAIRKLVAVSNHIRSHK